MSETDNGILGGLKEYKNQIGLASGDNFTSIKIMREIGLELYHPKTGEVMTGDEKKSRGGNEGQPSYAHFDGEDKDAFVSIFPPQDFPRNLRDGKIKIAIGAGYDIMVDSGGIENIRYLNGSYSDPETREEIMRKQLELVGYKGVNLGIKPVFYPVIANRKHDLRTTADCKNGESREVVSEADQIMSRFCKQKGFNISKVDRAYGGADNQVICGLYPMGTDIVESGGSLFSNVDKARLVKNEHGNMVIVIYSTPWLLTTIEEYDNERSFFDGLFALVTEGRKKAEAKFGPFISYDKEFERRFQETEKGLGLD